jgi:imidazolonepropionase-like amidohydrolase
LFEEMRAFQRNEPAISAEKVLEMVTVNSASALRQQNSLGRIRPGFRADLIAIPRTERGDVFAEIVAFEGEINWMMVGGKTVEPASACK